MILMPPCKQDVYPRLQVVCWSKQHCLQHFLQRLTRWLHFLVWRCEPWWQSLMCSLATAPSSVLWLVSAVKTDKSLVFYVFHLHTPMCSTPSATLEVPLLYMMVWWMVIWATLVCFVLLYCVTCSSKLEVSSISEMQHSNGVLWG